MKYPQLVSTKAVNEISDWLIKRLEDLDIEHPGVYSRLLLSLLHTPFKVNAIDLLEDLKQPYRLLNKNNEELKRLAAVESLMEVSAKENKSNIISLVDELHLKLRKIESNSDESAVAAITMNSRTSLSSSPISAANSKFYKNLKKIRRNHGMESSTKNYYLAFPALNGNKKLTTATIVDNKQLSMNDLEKSKKNDLNLLSWSNLMSKNKNQNSLNSSQCNDKIRRNDVVKSPLSSSSSLRGRKRRYGKAYKTFPKTDVQFTTKSSNLYDNATFSPKKMVKNCNKKHHKNQYDSSRNMKNCGIRNNNNFSNNAPKMDLTSGSTAPWDMDFTGKGHWEMDHDLISEFIQQQKKINHHNNLRCYNDDDNDNDHYNESKNDENMMKINKQQQQQHLVMEDKNEVYEEEDDVMLKCLPTKLIIDDESLVDDPLNMKVKPCNNKEALSISSLKLKFDENVKAIWSDVDGGNDSLKPLTYKHFDDDGSLSLASSFTSEKNSISLFNFNEQQQQQQQTHHFEVNAPLYTSEIYQQHSQHNQIQMQPPPPHKNMDYDCNNNNNGQMMFYGDRGAMTMSSSFTASPKHSDQMMMMMRSDFIKSGTNLQTSIWSDGEFASDAESLIFKEVADPKNDTSDAIYKNLSSIGAEIKEWQNKQENNNNININNNNNNNNNRDDGKVTLFNHSEESAFKKFSPLLSSTIIRANYHPLNSGYCERPAAVVTESLESSDNYLTSEKTHFNPIIRDGHTFVIDNSWDEINYERSQTGGGLVYKNKRYKLWNNNNNAKSANFGNDIDLIGMENDSSEFTIKYMLCENDKGCQTEENEFAKQINNSGRGFLEINEEYCKRKIYDEYFRGVNNMSTVSNKNNNNNNNKWRYVNNNGDDSNDYSFFSVNRVKNFNTINNNNNNSNNNNASNNNNNNNILPSQTFHDLLLSSNSSSSSICTITSSYDAPAAVDQFESWRSIKIDNCNSLVDSDSKQLSQACAHRLWEQCMTCSRNNEDPYIEKPLPANRLMKDELQLDGDEIMNVIQNLYITGDYCDEDEEKEDDCEEFDMNHVYMNMIMDDSMDGTIEEEESKFYEPTVDVKNQKNLASKIMNEHQLKNDSLNMENFDEITLTKRWRWDGKDKDHEKYLKLLNLIKTSLLNNANYNNNNVDNVADKNNNDCQSLSEVHRPKNRKRRHSTCQNFLDKKRYHSHDEGFTYHLNFDNSTPTFHETFQHDNNTNLVLDAAKMLKVNIEKILLIADPCYETAATESYKEEFEFGGANYYRNILQQQHALIKQLDLSRPLTR